MEDGETLCGYHLLCIVGIGGLGIMVSKIATYQEAVVAKYADGETNMLQLTQLGATLIFGVDATTMKNHDALQMREFDRIVFNFPNAGFLGNENDVNVILANRTLVNGFFKNDVAMIVIDGQVHVTLKKTSPYKEWNIAKIASRNGLANWGRYEFKPEQYPGYNCKLGSGPKADESFSLSNTYTFMFGLGAPNQLTEHESSHSLLPKQGEKSGIRHGPSDRAKTSLSDRVSPLQAPP